MIPSGHLLSVLIFFPALGALSLLLLKSDDEKWIRQLTFVISLVEFVFSLLLLWSVPVGTPAIRSKNSTNGSLPRLSIITWGLTESACFWLF